ncbi:uncharacterized protein N7458_007408 [Penicillium daleae]|uniref:Uncharacterized protein n=1 Tax=Penicillium daleae TaxID=63821 RepID=A0AAD6C115_9EURO|nr:uncharacterized protein N7458_007408 [Penicillium daleae]KAJ5443536.1 hypothetical protein N7458_007408 [Penicillium daleae]
MVGRRGKRGAASATTASPATRSARNPPTTHAPRARGRGRGRGRWANYWANRPGRPSTTARTEDQEESPIPPKRSHILKFKLPSLRKLGLFSSDNASSTDQADAFSTAPASTSAGSQNPETPRGRRSKRAMAVPESSRTTRQSARLKPSEELATEEATPSKLAEDVDSEAEAEADADVIADADADATEDEEDSSSQEEADQEDLAYTPKLRLRLSPPKPPALKLHFTSANKATDPDHPEASTEDQAMPEATESRQKDSQGADDEPYSAQLTEPPPNLLLPPPLTQAQVH